MNEKPGKSPVFSCVLNKRFSTAENVCGVLPDQTMQTSMLSVNILQPVAGCTKHTGVWVCNHVNWNPG
jgi:hypothetical protein